MMGLVNSHVHVTLAGLVMARSVQLLIRVHYLPVVGVTPTLGVTSLVQERYIHTYTCRVVCLYSVKMCAIFACPSIEHL